MRALLRPTAVAVFLTFVFAATAASASATTIDSAAPQITGGTLSDCDSTDVFHSDNHTPPPVSGPFNFSLTTAPATSNASCADGSGVDSTSGNLSSKGVIDAGGNLALTQSSHGTTTATVNYTGNPMTGGSIDTGDQVSTITTVQFTITQAMPYAFSGTISDTQNRFNYSLQRTSPSPAMIFDKTHGKAPNLSGTLPAGTYQYDARDFSSNDICCTVSGNKTDSFTYSLKLTVGTPPRDTSAPAIAITTPVGGAHYKQAQKVNASYSCTDPDGPADVALCAGPAANGKPIDTSTPGAHSFTVQAADQAGNRSTKTVQYTVDTTPSSPPIVKGFPPNKGCVPHGLKFRVSVHPTALKRVLVFLDGTQIASSKKPTFKVKIAASQLSAGRHKIVIERDYKGGTKRRSSFSFAVCKGGGKSPHIRTQGVPAQGTCAAKPFKIVVTITGAVVKTIAVKLDGKSFLKPNKAKFTLKIDTSKLKSGKHRLTITAADKFKNSSVSVTDFVRC